MAIGATRVSGSAEAGSFYGYQPLFFSVTNTATTVGTADTVPGGGAAITEGNFSKAVRGINTVGSIVFLGTRANAGFICAIDSATANAYVSANTNTDVAAALTAAIEAATGLTDVTVDALAMTFAELA